MQFYKNVSLLRRMQNRFLGLLLAKRCKQKSSLLQEVQSNSLGLNPWHQDEFYAWKCKRTSPINLAMLARRPKNCSDCPFLARHRSFEITVVVLIEHHPAPQNAEHLLGLLFAKSYKQKKQPIAPKDAEQLRGASPHAVSNELYTIQCSKLYKTKENELYYN